MQKERIVRDKVQIENSSFWDFEKPKDVRPTPLAPWFGWLDFGGGGQVGLPPSWGGVQVEWVPTGVLPLFFLDRKI